ncbi:aminoacyl-tRNA hydrolase [Corynebacterium diphtheriae]|uniref:aminoacyl-tRNA hydrolase n=1 Tax=Corynebacterium diphtheriae TaxID=1717 RepID=UPI000B4A7EA9|nr:aminoacyl-tRNA hydrolase [Corynebacterium diphtheriae]OWN43423.1 peptidyl-tRNA hydrolase [Corynebacterium diphtheriae bv. gravis]
MTSPYLIVGLGNPGPEYTKTRHNIGYMAIDELLTRTSPMPATLTVHKKTNTLVAETRLGTQKVIVAKPRAFMNVTGPSVRKLADFFTVDRDRIVVLYDDLDLEFGAIKFRHGGGDHGHNGLKSITQALGTKDYIRGGIGIGRPPGRMAPKSFVLKSFSKIEQSELPIVCADAADEVERITTSEL